MVNTAPVVDSTKDFAKRNPTLTGAATGAVVGSVVPVIGTVTGALVGGLLGHFAGRDYRENKK